ncbi:hypothetical protein DSCO28_05670 [Desulfosarcina ovata subsp. sediminis]|uniref:HTH merR-type domain-containing protein n=1 Tax=Desulfosarcina ovata subsp. sediminis TaxID=885957 RepID=A0A5K7ZGG4_9BACT|nr:hypothetical protein [Desulfosarcina ovata]BBO80001.1 hypothetical protein DSCO28_05670 [Desulfosarcina ovata subsp. sediminis]
MIHYYTNREISEKLEINLARWKRWSRSFLPPDPLGGMQSGYARQYVYKDLFKVFLGGHLLSHLKLSVAESQQVIEDLTPWLKRWGFLDLKTNGSKETTGQHQDGSDCIRVFFHALPESGPKAVIGFRYLVQKIVDVQQETVENRRYLTQRIEETLIHGDTAETDSFYRHPGVYMLNLSALSVRLVQRLRG